MGAICLLAPATNHGWYKPIFYWWHEMAACCYFGVDLGNGLGRYSLSRLADGTPYSSSDLLYFTLRLYLDKKILSPNFSFSPLGTKKILSPALNPQKNSKTIPNSVYVANRSNSTENFLRQFQILS